MTPDQRMSICVDYMEGELPDPLICAKYKITPDQLAALVRVGLGSLIAPEPLIRGMKRGIHTGGAVTRIASEVLAPDEMALSPLESSEVMQPKQRESALHLSDAELSFANNVLRGINPTAAAAASFEIYNEPLARKKAAELIRADNVAEYMSIMKGRTLFAPVRNKAYLEAVLWKVIDRSMELEQSFDMLGQPIQGRCAFNPKMVVAASALLARLKGWDNISNDVGGAESQRDRLRRLTAQHQGSNGNYE